jgi:hypothetical protein
MAVSSVGLIVAGVDMVIAPCTPMSAMFAVVLMSPLYASQLAPGSPLVQKAEM